LKLDTFYTLISILIGFIAALPLTLITARIERTTHMKIDPFNFYSISLPEFILLFILLTPLGEEFLFRGILESSLLGYGILIAVIVPALLFSLVHIVPFKNTPRKFLIFIMISAFILGVLAGYFRAISGSLLPAYSVHAIFNLSGRITEK